MYQVRKQSVVNIFAFSHILNSGNAWFEIMLIHFEQAIRIARVMITRHPVCAALHRTPTPADVCIWLAHTRTRHFTAYALTRKDYTRARAHEPTRALADTDK